MKKPEKQSSREPNEWVVLCGFLIFALGGCAKIDSAQRTQSQLSPIVVSVSPSLASLTNAQTQQFSAVVQNDSQNKGVTWALTQKGNACTATCGTLSTVGTNAVSYAAPTGVPQAASLTLTATSVADNTKSASAQITLSSSPPAAISVSVSPSLTSAQLSEGIQFSASVLNDSQDKGVIWTLAEAGAPCSPACGSLPAWTPVSALYTAPALPPNSSIVTLTATSLADSTKTATATIFVAGPSSNSGPNGLSDITSYGARPTAFSLGAKANCISGSHNVSIDVDPGFVNGDGAVLYGCGPSTTIGAPAAATVNPGVAEGEMAPDIPLAISSGSSTYQYSTFSTTIGGGLTAASPPVTITNGQAALGMISVNATSANLLGNTLTITTSLPHGMPMGAWFDFRGATPGTLNGRYSAYAVTSTTITVTNLPFQAPGVGLRATGGTVTYAVGNQISVATPPAGSFNVLVCGMRPGDSALHIVGAIPVGGYARGYYFSDWGAPFSLSASFFPSYITDTACTATSPTPGYLSSFILSGAGTNSLVLADSASQTVPGQSILQDDGPALVAAAKGNPPTSSGGVYIPPVPSGWAFHINSVTVLPSNMRILQAGNLHLNEPIEIRSPIWQGASGTCAPQFALKTTTCLNQGTAFPAMYLTGGINVSYVSLMVNPNDLGIVANSYDGWLYLDTVQFGAPGLGTIPFVTFGQTDIATIMDSTFNGSQDGSDASWVPLVYFDILGNSGGYNITNPRLSGRGMFVNDNSNLPGGSYGQARQVTVTNAYDQGASLPLLAVQNTGNGNTATDVLMTAPQIDTSSESAISLSAIPGVGSLYATVELDDPNSSGGTAQYVTGVAPEAYYPVGVYFPPGLNYPEASIGDSPNGGQLATPRPYAYDNFNRPNSTSMGCPSGFAGTCWAVLGGSFSISANQMLGGVGNGNFSFAEWVGWNLVSQGAGQFSQVTITKLTGAAGPTVLSSPGSTGTTTSGYVCAETGSSVSLAGPGTAIATASHTNLPGDIVRLEWQPGGTLNCYINGVIVAAGNDTIYTTGQPGIFAMGGGGITDSLDNWSGGVLHPYSTSDQEEDRTQPLHVPALTIGPTSPGAHGSLPFGAFYLAPVSFANLGTPDDGVLFYCPDCTITDPCTGSGTGAIAKRLNGVWVCN